MNYWDELVSGTLSQLSENDCVRGEEPYRDLNSPPSFAGADSYDADALDTSAGPGEVMSSSLLAGAGLSWSFSFDCGLEACCRLERRGSSFGTLEAPFPIVLA